jgi:hypothetical protein
LTAGTRDTTALEPSTASTSRPRRPWLRRFSVQDQVLGLVLLASLLFYLGSAWHFAGQPLRIEENEWPPMAHAIVEHGKPVIEASEGRRFFVDWDASLIRSERIGLWHPPLYMYSLAAVAAVAGKDADAALRLVGILALLASCGLLFAIAREVTRERWFAVGAVASTLVLLHPMAIQGSTFLDIDTGIYAPLFLAFMWMVIRSDQRGALTPLRGLALAAMVAVLLWAKLPTVFILAPVLALWWLLRAGWRGLVRSVVVLVLGGALFLGTYALYCWAASLPFDYTFEVLKARRGPLGWEAPPGRVRATLDWHIRWFLPVLLLLAAAYGGAALVRLVRTRRVLGADLLWGFGIAVFLCYAVVTPMGDAGIAAFYQGKYAYPAIAALALPIAVMLTARPLTRADVPWLGFAAVVGLVAGALMPDPVTAQHFGVTPVRDLVLIAAGSAAALVLAGFSRRFRTWLGWGALVVVAALLSVQSLHAIRADTSPLYPVTDTADFETGTDFMNAEKRPGDIAVASKDMTHYIKAPVVDSQDLYLRGDPVWARFIANHQQVTMVSTSTFWPAVGGETSYVLSQCFADIHQFGTVTVYLRTKRCRGVIS